MNTFLKSLLEQIGYRHEGTQVVVIDSVKHNARFVATAVSQDGHVAQHLGVSEEDAETKLVNMLKRP
jgi:hypothetical protein